MVNETKNAVVSRSMTGAQNSEPRISSIEIAWLTGKQHKHVMEAIRKMESAWEKSCGSNFRLTSRTIIQPNGGTREVPCYDLTKTECLFIATKFNDTARARLVLRWEELERDARSKMADGGEQKLLVTESDILKQSDAIRREQIGEENAPADGCLTASEIAKIYGMTVKDLNKKLSEEGIQFWNGGRYKLNPRYEENGWAQDRAFHYYTLDGEKKQRFYLVWTQLGAEMIGGLIG